MPKLVRLLADNKMTLMVSLPCVDFNCAEAAIAGGADALQLNITEQVLDDLAKKKKHICHILDCVKHPVGIAIAKTLQLDKKKIKQILDLGFDFINLSPEQFHSDLARSKVIDTILSLNSRYALDDLPGLAKQGIKALDAAIIPVAEKGKLMVVGDLQQYISIVISAGLPVIIPTQRAIKPSEVAIIADTGAKGLMLTQVVCGTTAKNIAKAVGEYRIAVDDLG